MMFLLSPGRKKAKIKLRMWIKSLFFGGAGLYFLGFWLFYLTGSLLYFGEAVSYEGLIRMLMGLPFASSTPSLPISLTPYSPLFLLPLATLGKLFGLSGIEKVMVWARFHQTVLLVILFLSINQIRKHFFSGLSNGASFLLACVLVFSYSPTMVLALRPDTLSFLAECWALYFILSYLRETRNHFLYIASLFFSLALAIKLNTAGCFLGTIGFFFFKKDWKSCLILGLFTAGLTFLFLLTHELFLGDAFSKNILLSIQSQIWHFSGLIEVYKKVFDLFLIPLTFYFVLIFWGLHSFQSPDKSKLFIWTLSTSFVLAFLGQLKWGAFHNYFLGVLYLGLIPASCGIYQLKKSSKSTLYFSVGILVFFFCARNLSIPSKIFLDRRYFFELRKLQEWVKEKVPSGFIVTNDEKIYLGFVGKTALGVLTGELIGTTPKLKFLIPQLKEELVKAGGPKAFITLCSNPPSADLGFVEPVKWERSQTGYYCLYTHATP